jgi:hypothetical protein
MLWFAGKSVIQENRDSRKYDEIHKHWVRVYLEPLRVHSRVSSGLIRHLSMAYRFVTATLSCFVSDKTVTEYFFADAQVASSIPCPCILFENRQGFLELALAVPVNFVLITMFLR